MFAIPLILASLIVLALIIVFGGKLLQKMLPPGHSLQKYLSDDSIEIALAWSFRNARYVVGWGLVVAFTVITLVYS